MRPLWPTFRGSSCPTREHQAGQGIPRSRVGRFRNHRPRTRIFDHLIKTFQPINFLAKNINSIHAYFFCHWYKLWNQLILHEQSGWFSQLQGILEFEGCPDCIKQSERLCKIKQGMNENSTVFETTVNKTPVRNLPLSPRSCC